MSIISDRTKKVNDLMSKVKNHCMCLHFTESSTHYMVYYPFGYYPNGVRVKKVNNKSNSLELLLNAMERHWEDSCWWKK